MSERGSSIGQEQALENSVGQREQFRKEGEALLQSATVDLQKIRNEHRKHLAVGSMLRFELAEASQDVRRKFVRECLPEIQSDEEKNLLGLKGFTREQVVPDTRVSPFLEPHTRDLLDTYLKRGEFLAAYRFANQQTTTPEEQVKSILHIADAAVHQGKSPDLYIERMKQMLDASAFENLYRKEQREHFRSEILEAIGILLVRQGRIPEAYAQAKELAPSYRSNKLLDLIIETLTHQGNPKEAYAYAMKIREGGAREAAVERVILAYAKKGEFEKALELIPTHIREKRGRVRPRLLLEIAQHMVAQGKDAKALIEEARGLIEGTDFRYASDRLGLLNELAFSLSVSGQVYEPTLASMRPLLEKIPGSSQRAEALQQIVSAQVRIAAHLLKRARA